MFGNVKNVWISPSVWTSEFNDISGCLSSACSVMNAFCIIEVQHKAKRGRAGCRVSFRICCSQTDTKCRGWSQYTSICWMRWLALSPGAFRYLVLICFHFFHFQSWGLGEEMGKFNALQWNTTTNHSFNQQLLKTLPANITQWFYESNIILCRCYCLNALNPTAWVNQTGCHCAAMWTLRELHKMWKDRHITK